MSPLATIKGKITFFTKGIQKVTKYPPLSITKRELGGFSAKSAQYGGRESSRGFWSKSLHGGGLQALTQLKECGLLHS
jgi:hypothetical protein